MKECVDPTAKQVGCIVCEKTVHTCERKEPVGILNIYLCPVHPDGCEVENGNWVCTEKCWNTYTTDLD